MSSNGGKLPADLPPNWRDLVARVPFLEKANQDLNNDKKKVEKESKVKEDILSSDLRNRDETINSLQTDLSQVKAENTHLKEYDLKKVNDKLNKWETTFKGQEAYEVERELNKPKLTKEQQEKINNYDDIKRQWEEWIKAFPPVEFSTPEKARTKYDEALRNQKPLDHDKISEDLREWQTAFPTHKFPKNPQGIRNDYDKLTTNQKPTDYEQLKSDLERWTKIFSGPEFQGQEPAQIRAIIEKYKDDLSLRESDLLAKYREDISRLVDNNISRLKHISKDSLNSKYGQKVDKIAEAGLTLENVPASMQNLNAMIATCATEKASEWSKQIESMDTNDDNRATQITEITEFLSKIESIWKRVPLSPEKNNPFYLPLIADKSTHQDQIKSLITKWSIQKRILLGYEAAIENPQLEAYIEQK